MTGAARLASEAAMHMGCGLCTIVSSAETKNIYLSGEPHIMFEPYKDLKDFVYHLADPRRTAALMGPGAGKTDPDALRRVVLDVLALDKPVVLDADALNVFEGKTDSLFSGLYGNCVLTPHEGEFSRLFPELKGSKEERATEASRQSGAIVILKGAETIIANPNGQLIVNDHSTPWLATAGSGDVLAGMIGGLLAQGMDIFKACAAATWIHGEAAITFGAGLTAPDIIGTIPKTLDFCLNASSKREY